MTSFKRPREADPKPCFRNTARKPLRLKSGLRQRNPLQAVVAVLRVVVLRAALLRGLLLVVELVAAAGEAAAAEAVERHPQHLPAEASKTPCKTSGTDLVFSA